MQNNLNNVRSFLDIKLGLNYTETREKELYAKLTEAAKGFDFENTDVFIDWMLKQTLNEKLEKKLADFLTIGETYFFREKKALDFLEFKYLPELIESRKGKNQQLKIWSAGCSSGEEPYSIAILINRLIKNTNDWKITILASDINSSAIQKAQNGIYTNWSFRKTDEEFKTKFFRQVGHNKFQINDSIKKQVTFKHVNLASDNFPSVEKNIHNFDVILCRNVLIYFSQEGIQKVAEKFYKTLTNTGVLLTSPVEASSIMSSSFSYFNYQGAIVFNKTKRKEELPKNNLVRDIVKTNNKRFVSIPKKENTVLFEKPGMPKESLYSVPSKPVQSEKKQIETNKILPENELMKAQEKANKGDLLEAEKLCLSCIGKDKINENAYYLLASVYSEQGKTSEAVKALNNTLFLNPEFVLAHFLLGKIHLNNKNAEAGKRHFKNALNCLAKFEDEKVIGGSEGLTCGNLKQIINAAMV